MNKENNLFIFVVDDDIALNKMICMYLENEGFKRVKGFGSGSGLIEALPQDEPAIIIQDYDLPGKNGLEILKEVKPKYPNIEFVFLSGQSKIEVAVNAIKLGAFDYIIKDKFASENVHTKIKNIQKINRLQRERISFKYGMFLFASLLAIVLIILSIFFVHK